MYTPTVLYLVADACTCLTVYGEFYGWQRCSKIVIVGLYKLFNICQKFNKFIRFKSERHTTKTASFSHCGRGLKYFRICTFFYENLAWTNLLPCCFKMPKKTQKTKQKNSDIAYIICNLKLWFTFCHYTLALTFSSVYYVLSTIYVILQRVTMYL